MDTASASPSPTPIFDRLRAHYKRVDRRLGIIRNARPVQIDRSELEQRKEQHIQSLLAQPDFDWRLEGCPFTEPRRRAAIFKVLRRFDLTWQLALVTKSRQPETTLCRRIIMKLILSFSDRITTTRVAQIIGVDKGTVPFGLRELDKTEWDRTIFFDALACV